ncbi:MAG TPA: hypothetical protein VGJ66_01170 [Pyrinomonadaceae bacterium]
MAGITYLSTGAEFSFNPLSIDSEIIDVNEIQSMSILTSDQKVAGSSPAGCTDKLPAVA